MSQFGLSSDYKYYEFELDSLDSIVSADSTQTRLNWPIFNIVTPITRIAAFKVLEVQIPFSWYTINTTNQNFTVTTTNPVQTAVTVTIPVGNYTSATLITALTTALAAATVTVTFSSLTGKFTFAPAAGTISFTFGTATDNGSTNPRFILGFDGGAASASASLVAPNIAAITGPNYLYINSRQFGNQLDVILPGGATLLGSGSAGPQIAKVCV